jgi:hypothetical protein
MKNKIIAITMLIAFSILMTSCGKKQDEQKQDQTRTTEPQRPAEQKTQNNNPVNPQKIKKNGVLLRLNLFKGFETTVTTTQNSTTITAQDDQQIKTTEESKRKYKLECLKLEDDGTMLVKKTFTEIKMKSQRQTNDETITLIDYDSERPQNDKDKGAFFNFAVGRSIYLRLNPLGQVLGKVGGGIQIANELTLAMQVNEYEALSVRNQLIETFKQTPAFLLEYPQEKITVGQTWEAPFAFTQGTGMEMAPWKWKLKKLKNGKAYITVTGSGNIDAPPGGDNFDVQSNVIQDSKIELTVDIKTGIVENADINSQMTGNVLATRKTPPQKIDPNLPEPPSVITTTLDAVANASIKTGI